MARSLCVANPEIKEVLDCTTGEILAAQAAIGNDYPALEKLRMRLAEEADAPAYICPICHVGVYLACTRSGDDKRFYFKHRVEDGNCPAITRAGLTMDEMEARKYNGQKESAAHQRMKDILFESLSCDPDFSEVRPEKVWKDANRGEWRKPDVQALWRGKQRIAFEVQLSTTFLHVIAGRRRFYQQQGGLLVWVFQRFEKTAARMTQDDIFFNNNQNLFLASEATLQASGKAGELVLDCRWVEPQSAPGGGVEDAWRQRMTRFSELTQDLERQRIYYFDHEGRRPALLRAASSAQLRSRFEAWWLSSDDPSHQEPWPTFKREFTEHGVALPEFPFQLKGLLNALLSAREGRPMGYRMTKLVSVAHNVANYYPAALQPFRAALHHYGRANQLREEDKPKDGAVKGKWMARVEAYRAEMAAGSSRYEREREWDPLVAFLFPEVGEVLREWDTMDAASKATLQPS